MKKYFIFAAFAGVALASCTDDLVDQAGPPVVEEEVLAPISFSSSQNAFTRAEFKGAEAAEKLGKKFVVAGFKGDATASPGSVVFDNYFVEYTANTANTTESNTANWEYVSKTPIKHATDNGITQQAIKYWDFTKTQYDFFAWSTGTKKAIYEGDYADGEVLVTNIQPNSETKTWRTVGTGTYPDPARMAYTLSGKAKDLKECYITDILTVYKKNAEGTAPFYNIVENGYQKTVTLKFRQLGTKVRIGLYETVPGYSVRNVKFYTKAGALEATSAGTATTPGVVKDGQIVENATIFSTDANIFTEGTYKIYFPTLDKPTDADNNQAHITFAPKDETAASKTTIVDWGKLNYTYRESGEKDNGAIYLGRASNNATYASGDDTDENFYKIFLPNESNGNLNLRVDFTLESIDGSGETIEVKNAKAQVPSIYTTWKPGFAYTYLFKISDNTNGRTGVFDPTQTEDATINSDPAGLYPITFDALVVDAEDQTQETITTIATPSITTYQNGSKVVNNDEYTVLAADAVKKIDGHIYVTVNDNASPGTLITLKNDPDDNDGVALYTITPGMTEEEVVDALTYQDKDDAALNTIKGRSGKVLTKTTEVTTADAIEANKWMLTNKVQYGVNGNEISLTDVQAMRFQPAASTTYAFVYTQTKANVVNNKDYYEAIAADKFTTFTGTKYRYNYKGTVKSHTIETTDYFDAQKGHVYFTRSGDAEPYTYAKVAKPFIGQGAANLFTRSGAAEPYTYTKATTDYAQTGVTYYYTTDGQHYTEAHNVPYNETNSLTGLYQESTTPGTYVDAVGTQPVDGKAYYYQDGSNYIYCVFLPQQVNGMYELDKDADKVKATESTPVDGQTYFDKYEYNDAKRYAKVIKVAATPVTP